MPYFPCRENAPVSGIQQADLTDAGAAGLQSLQVFRNVIPDGGYDAKAGNEDALCQEYCFLRVWAKIERLGQRSAVGSQQSGSEKNSELITQNSKLFITLRPQI